MARQCARMILLYSGHGSSTQALKLSNDYHINEVDCVNLLVAAHREWNLLGREPLKVLRLSAGLWFTERRALITSVELLLRAVVLDEDLDPDFVADIRQYLESLFDGGFRKRLISLIKVAYPIMFSVVISLMSDALGGGQEVLSSVSRFRQEFQQLIMDDHSSAPIDGFTGVIRLVWAVFLMLTSGPTAPEGISKAESNARTCLDWACEHNAFQFLTSNILKTAAFQIKDLKDLAMIALDSYMHEMRDPLADDAARVEQQGLQAQAKPFISFLDLISEVYQREPELTLDNDLL